MIDPEKYMVVMALAVVPRKKLGHKCNGCGDYHEPVRPLILSLEDGSRIAVEPRIIVGSLQEEDGKWIKVAADGSLERCARETLEGLLNQADEILAMHKEIGDPSAVVVSPGLVAPEACA